MNKNNQISLFDSNNKTILLCMIVLISMAAMFCLVSCAESPHKAQKANQASPYLVEAEGKYGSGTHHAIIHMKDLGDIELELNANEAPITVSNFARLVDQGFYNGLTFHRIIKGFMIQGGDPLGNGTGGSDQNIKGEFSANGVANHIPHNRGVISMARSADLNSASSQFFICHDEAPSLNGQYAAFGHVISGMDVVDAIAQDTPVLDKNGKVAPENQPVIESIEMID